MAEHAGQPPIIPPFRFATVEVESDAAGGCSHGLYRSAYPSLKNFRFLEVREPLPFPHIPRAHWLTAAGATAAAEAADDCFAGSSRARQRLDRVLRQPRHHKRALQDRQVHRRSHVHAVGDDANP